ncbi:hypothetical protein [Halomonas sp. MS1]|nr:hypothetical protein [Halomonas sp. MS1]UTD55919.1 hypothetical protein NF683_01485 [Halomonas sp. MS1]
MQPMRQHSGVKKPAEAGNASVMLPDDAGISIQIPLGASLSPDRARGIWMLALFSAEPAGFRPHYRR